MESTPKNKAIIIVSLLSMLTGLIVLTGWFLNSIDLESIIPGFVTIKVNPALCFIFLGISLLITQLKPHKFTTAFYFVLLVLVTLTGLVTFLEYQFHVNAGIDQFLVTDQPAIAEHYPFPGRMALNTSICFIFLGSGLLGLTTKRNRLHTVYQYLLHIVTIISSVALLGYLYGVALLYNLFYISSMALNTAIVLFLLSIVATLLNPDLGITKLFTGKGIGNLMVRRHFILMVLMIVVFGSLRLQLQRYHIFSFEFGISLLAMAFLLSSLVLIWNTAKWLNKVDDERLIAVAEVKSTNDQLEKRVEERSAELLILLDELQKSEERYRSLFEQASDSIYVLNSKGDFINVNNSMCQMIGYTRKELLTMNIVELVDAEILIIYPMIYPQLVPGHSIISERKLIRKGGTIIDVEVNIQKFADERVLVIARDITERKIMENELLLSEQKYKMLFDSNPLPLWMIVKSDLSIIAVNKVAIDLYGYTKNELLKMTIRDMRLEEDMGQVLDNYKLELDKSADMGITRHIKKDGTMMFVQVIAHDIVFEGKQVRLALTNDVTEKIKAEQIHQKTEANLQTILNTTDTAYALLDNNLDVLEYNNKALVFVKNEFNVDPEDGKKMFDYIPRERRMQFFEHINEVLEGNNISYEISYNQHGGSNFWYHIRMFPISNKEGEILGLVLAATDITQQKEIEQNLQTAYDRIQTQIKFIREIVWKQSHILRSPLANLKGLVTILENDPGDSEALSHISTELERMDKTLIEIAGDSSRDGVNY